MTEGQRRVLRRSFLVAGVSGLFYPIIMAYGLGIICLLVLLAMLLLRLFLIIYGFASGAGRRSGFAMTGSETFSVAAADQIWPVYSVLVPAYQEVPVMEQLAAALCRLNWPAARLEIQILLEAEDEATCRAACAAAFPAGTRLTIVPPGGPRTKPNALNFGLGRALGEFICVYDAEDRPLPEQLREAYGRFRQSDPGLACLKAPLIGRAVCGSWISGHWALEYLVNFKLIQPALARLGLPVSLGGTSNYFRTSVLREHGGWDAWNFTEDADLGYRLLRHSLRIEMITSPTFEDAPDRFPVWLSQRSRWLKGFMKTWGVLMRTPGQLLSELGGLQFICLQLTLGSAILGPFLVAPLMLGFIIGLCFGIFWSLPGWILLCLGLTVLILGDIMALRFASYHCWPSLLTRCAYWPLHTLAAIKAAWELVRCPWFWAKTPLRPSSKEESFECWTGSLA
ncbi:MAG: N-acetylglucosaminyltransferase [Hyphomonadaceae bacterium]|nr:N-acetylglucosaminyltransferase [Hyphomonadaceae bacterium]OUX93088.1 MAG: hypothetical protein CBB77_10250 [Hyphomonas sp. TMED17]